MTIDYAELEKKGHQAHVTAFIRYAPNSTIVKYGKHKHPDWDWK